MTLAAPILEPLLEIDSFFSPYVPPVEPGVEGETGVRFRTGWRTDLPAFDDSLLETGPDEAFDGMFDPMPFTHVTVMRDEVVEALSPRDGGLYVDCTAGGGGHSAAILEQAPGARVISVDRDPAALEAATARLAAYGERAQVVHGTFATLPQVLAELGVGKVDGLLADLGVSSPQLNDPERGMSFRSDGPLDMRMDPGAGETALELLARIDQDALADVIYQYGEERRSRSVARCIKQSLEAGTLHTTLDLRRAVVRAVGPRRVGGIDPATRTFQALRIAVNGELTELEALLKTAPRLLAAGGRAAFISFHSLEDRLVKRAFLEREVWHRLTSKPVLATEEERTGNPRSRSAKLRAAELVEVLP